MGTFFAGVAIGIVIGAFAVLALCALAASANEWMEGQK